LITELVKGLGSLMRRRDPKTHKSDDDPGDVFDAMASILTPFDETQYWSVTLGQFNFFVLADNFIMSNLNLFISMTFMGF
jgi:hypothetical protein